MYNFLANTKRMTVAAMVMALYIVILYVTQGISFGPYQIRIATSLYALAFVYPFLVVPLGLANFIANFLFGGLHRHDRRLLRRHGHDMAHRPDPSASV